MQSIGIIGAGNVGEALATLLVNAGDSVKVANSRGRKSLVGFAQRTGAKAVDIDDIAHGVDVLIVAVPMARIPQLPKTVISTIPQGAIVVDAGNYYPLRDGKISELENGLAESQWVSEVLGLAVVKAFNNIIAAMLATGGRPEGDPNRIALPVAGDDAKARASIMAIVERLGFDAVDAGPLSGSWRQEPGQPAYCTDPSRSELTNLLGRADKRKAPLARDKASKILSKLPEDYPANQLVLVSRTFVGLDKFKPANWAAVLRLVLTIIRSRK